MKLLARAAVLVALLCGMAAVVTPTPALAGPPGGPGDEITRGAIAGRVVVAEKDGDGVRPVPRATVQLRKKGSDTVLRTEKTGPKGQFEFRGVPAGEYVVRAGKPELGVGIEAATVEAKKVTRVRVLLKKA